MKTTLRACAIFLVIVHASHLQAAEGLAAKYPGDEGIANDPQVLFANNFESGDMKKWDEKRGRVVMTGDKSHAGRWSVQARALIRR